MFPFKVLLLHIIAKKVFFLGNKFNVGRYQFSII